MKRVFFVILLSAGCLLAQSSKTRQKPQNTLQQVMKLMRSENPTYRESALYFVDPYLKIDSVKVALIRMLGNENALHELWWQESQKLIDSMKYTTQKELYEDLPNLLNTKFKNRMNGEAMIELVEKVMRLHDRRSIDALSSNLCTSSDVQNEVVRYGRTSLSILLEKHKTTHDIINKSIIIEVISKIVKKSIFKDTVMLGDPVNILSLSQKAELMQVAIEDAKNPNEYFYRKNAVELLGLIGDETVLPLLRNIQENDPDKTARKIVKTAAGKAIIKIERRAKRP